MDLLVSACNRPQQRLGETGDALLLRVCTSSGKIQPVFFPDAFVKDAWGMTGIVKSDRGYICLLQPQSLLYLSENLEPEALYPLNLVRDGHSLAFWDGACYIASSGTDSIVAFSPQSGERMFWSANRGGNDTIHLNSLISGDDGCFATAFGLKAGELWRSAEEGYVFNVLTGKRLLTDLYHPHSLVILNGTFYLCESSTMTLRSSGGLNFSAPCGYLRGLAVAESQIFIGSTKGRRRSRSTNVLMDNDPSRDAGQTGVAVLCRQESSATPALDCFIDLSQFAEEVYDIIIAP